LKFGTRRETRGLSEVVSVRARAHVKGSGNVQTDDVGTTIDLSIYTKNAQYITECNVESATNQ
jgi:hypothetical protein